MKFTSRTAIAGAFAPLGLSVMTIVSMSTGLRANDCTQDGYNIGLICRDQHPNECSDCVFAACGVLAQGDGACYDTCQSAGRSICSS
jgi:hypothetical protein